MIRAAREKRAGMICETEQFPFAETCNARAELPREFRGTRGKERGEGGREREIGSAGRTEEQEVARRWMGARTSERVRWKKARTP